jgi:DNA-binding GntR family transcriptional regulator
MQLDVVSVADAVAAELRRRLLAGEYEGGQELKDTELSEEFGVARPTLRSAVQTLVDDGLLERGRGRSARVKYLTSADAVDLYRLRGAIEAAAVRVVMTSKPSLVEVQRAVDDFLALEDDVSWMQVADADVAFHRAVMTAAGSPRILRTFDDISAELRLMIAQLRPSYRDVKELALEHSKLLRLVESGGVEDTVMAWQDHLDGAQTAFIELLQRHDDERAGVGKAAGAS